MPPPFVVTTYDEMIRSAARVACVPPVVGIGSVLAGYELRERIGVGGMATVYRAYDRALGREVAIKVPRLTDGDRAHRLEMFAREARATARLSHPNIVVLHHVGQHDGAPFVVLELLAGETLADRLARRGRLEPREAIAILDGVLRALTYAHDRGLIHRDLTPRNVFLTHDDRVKLLDFGVAVEREAAIGPSTRSAGTPGYMAPEHADQPGPRCDLWAAGVVFLECITGRRPPREPAARPSVPADLPRPVREMLARALDRDPANRPDTARDMRSALVHCLRPEVRPRRTRPWWWLLVLAALASGVGGWLVARWSGPAGRSYAVSSSAMPTEFRFDHVFRAPSVAAVLAAYFDPDHLASQDAAAELVDRTVVESRDDAAVRSTSWRVQSAKQMPVYARPFIEGGRVRYLESMTWRKADDAIDLVIHPEILGGRVTLTAVYELTKIGDEQIRRRYRGQVAANIRLIGGKIERGVLTEIERGIPTMAACTQAWLDATRTAAPT